MFRSHSWSLETKTSKNVYDIRKLVLGCTSVPKPIWQAFRGQKMVKIGVSMYKFVKLDSCLKCAGKNPHGPTNDPWGGLLYVGVNTAWAVCNDERPSMICVLIDGASLPTIHQHLQKLLVTFHAQISNKNHGCAARRRPSPSTDPRSIDHGVAVGTAISSVFLVSFS